MAVEYCSKCGFKHEYTLHVPNFCQKCGSSLTEEFSAASVQVEAAPITPAPRSAPRKARRTRSSFEESRKRPRYENEQNIDNNINDIAEASSCPDITSLPNINKLEIDIDTSNIGPRQFKMEDVKDVELNSRPSSRRKRKSVSDDPQQAMKDNMSDLNTTSRYSV